MFYYKMPGTGPHDRTARMQFKKKHIKELDDGMSSEMYKRI